MNLHLHFPSLLGFADNNLIVILGFVAVITLIKTIGRTQRQRYWADTARAAIDRNQPVPPAPPFRDRGWRSSGNWGWSRGLIWIAAGVAFFFIPEHNLREWAPLPICIGIAMLAIGVISWLAGRDSNRRPPSA